MVIWLPSDLDTCLIRSRTFGVVLICLSTCIMCLWHTLLFWICFLVNCFIVSAPRCLAPTFPFSFTPNNLSIFVGYAIVSWVHFWRSDFENAMGLFGLCSVDFSQWLWNLYIWTSAAVPQHSTQVTWFSFIYSLNLKNSHLNAFFSLKKDSLDLAVKWSWSFAANRKLYFNTVIYELRTDIMA